MRLIDIDALDWEEVEARHGKRNEVVVDCEILIELAPTVNQWIPCSERLPETCGKYLVTRKWKDNSGEEHITVIISWYKKYDVIGLDWSDFDVIAWQRLPEPCREGGES